MAPDPKGIVSLVSEYYAGALDTRALWEWAGGRPEDVPFSSPPEVRWEALWRAAEAPGGATRIRIVREMLFDRPGDPDLLDCTAVVLRAMSTGRPR